MMDEHPEPNQTGVTLPMRPRPVLLTALCLCSFVYFGLVSALFLLGIFYSGTLAGVIGKYGPPEVFMKFGIRTIVAGGLLLHLVGITGAVMMWNLRKTGYYLFATACLVISAIQLFIPGTALLTTAVYILFILLFGMFFNRLH